MALMFSLAAPLACLAAEVSIADYPSIQAAVDANPGRMLLVPPGEYHVTDTVMLNKDGSGLYGYGTIIQDNAEKAVVRIDHARGVRLRDLTLTRAEGAKDATAPGVLVTDAQDARLEGLRVVDCRARDAAVDLRNASNCTVRDCDITNYKRIAVDDRTGDSGGNVRVHGAGDSSHFGMVQHKSARMEFDSTFSFKHFPAEY